MENKGTRNTRRTRREKGIRQLPDGRWLYSWYFRGRQKRHIAPTYAIAKACLAKVRAEIAEGKFLERDTARTQRFEDVVAQFLKWGKRNLSPGQQRRDRECAALWLAFPRFKGRTLAEIGPADVEAYREERLTAVRKRTLKGVTFEIRPAGKRTADLDLARLRRLFSLCIKWRLTRENPAREVDFFRPESKRDRFLSHDEEAAILRQSPPDIRPAVVFAVNTGLRQMELLSLTWGQVDRAGRAVTVTADKAKSGKSRRVPLNALAYAALETQPRGFGGAPVFAVLARKGEQSLGRRFNTVTKRAGVNKDAGPQDRVTWHTLRHTFASRLVMGGADLLTVQKLLGHSSLAMVMRYAHLAETHIKEAVEALEGGSNKHKTSTVPADGAEGVKA